VPPATERYAAAVAPLGLRPTGLPIVHAGEEAERWGERWLAERFGVRAPVALCPGARHATKRWPEEYWVALDRRLASAGRTRLYFSLERERRALPALAAEVERAADADWCVEGLPRMAALLSRSAAAVSNDSGLMHLAAARGLRVVAIFGSTSPVLGFAPAGAGHVVLCRNLSCQPCTLHGRERCPKGHFRCMKELTPDVVGGALDAMLAAPPVPLETVWR
jgi:heptosyltransferase-2